MAEMMVKMRHLEMTELLALRDGESTAHGRDHLECCESCRRELERLYRVQAELRALPSFTPPRDLWPRIARLEWRRRHRQRWWIAGSVGLAAAAALVGFLVLRGDAVRGPGDGAEEVWVAEAMSEDLGPVITRSRQLETLLETYRPQYQVYDAPTALAVSALEDRIWVLDRMLSEGRQAGAERVVLRRLWNERVATLETLIGIQLGEASPAVRRNAVWR
jgi:predicted anti-sigma-YlaC factor YlaD